LQLCGDRAEVSIDVRNITTSSVTGNEVKLDLPTGIWYEKGSVSGTGVSEKTVTNLNEPTFSLPDLAVTKSSTFTIKIHADCDLEGFLTGGGVASIEATASYTGGKTSHKSLPLTIHQPSVNVSNITNQFYSGGLGDQFIRIITISNNGSGPVEQFDLRQISEAGILHLGYSGGTVTASGDTLFAHFDTTAFKKVGNKDIWLDKNESVVLRDTVRIAACQKLASTFRLTWGCNKKICKSLTYKTNIQLVNKSPKLEFLPGATLNSCFDPAVGAQQSLRIVNVGDDTARSVNVSIFQTINTGFDRNVLSQIDTSTLYYRIGAGSAKRKAKITSVQYALNTGIYACLGNNAIGFMEMELPDIMAGDSVFLEWESLSCCVTQCAPNFYSHRWNYKADYRDQCDQKIVKAETYGRWGYRQFVTLTSYTPTDIVSTDTAKFSYTISNISLINNTVNSELKIRFHLPKGTKHSLKTSDFRFETHDGSTWSPSSLTQSGDTITGTFKGRVPFSLVNGEFNIRVIGDCSSSSSNTNASYGLHWYYTPNTTCSNPCTFYMYCQSGTVRVHCDNSCSAGLKFGDFKAYRVSYGQPDNDNNGEPDATGSLDLDKIKRERVMYGDTLLTVFRGRINRNGSTLSWSRLTATSTVSYGRYLEVADVTVRILRSKVQLYRCSGISSSYSTTGNSRTFTFDLSTSALIAAKCPLYSGFVYTPSDSVEVYVKYAVSTNPGNFFRTVDIDNSFYLHTVANPTATQRFQCDTFQGQFMLAGSYLTNWGRNIYQLEGCSDIEVAQSFYLSIGNCCSNYAGGNLFPYEYRQWAKLSEIKVLTPPGFDVVNSRMFYWRTSGTRKTNRDYVDTLRNIVLSGDTASYAVDSLFADAGGSLKVSDDGFHGTVYTTLRPNCLARDGANGIDYAFTFQEKGNLGNQKQEVHSTYSDEIEYSAPVINLNTLSDEVLAKSDTAEWQVVIDNSSPTSLAKHVWIAAQGNGRTTIERITNTKDGSDLPSSNGIFQLGDLAKGQAYTLKIQATFTSCDRDSFFLFVGHECSGYPSGLATSKCHAASRKLYFVPQNTLLESSIISDDSVVDLCAYSGHEITVSNLADARAYDLYVDLFLSDGSILHDSAYLFIPGQSDSFLVTNPVYLGSGQYRWEISRYNQYLDTNGLAGVTSTTHAKSYRLKFRMSTDCDFVSSTYFLARPGGKLKCGKDVLTSYSASKPIDIKGIRKPYFSDLRFEKKPIDACNYDGTGQMRFINLGPDTTGDQDYIQLILPPGIYLDTTYLGQVHNSPASNPTVEIGLNYKGVWKIPKDVLPGDSVVFNYKTYVSSPELECGTTRIKAQAVVSQPAICVKDSSVCMIDVSTSNDLMLDSISKAVYSLSYVSGFSSPSNGLEKVDIQYTVKNTGALKENGVLLQVKLVADTNSNGLFDVDEPVLLIDSIVDSIALNQQLSRIIQGEILSEYACNLLLSIDTSSCVCSYTSMAIPAPQLINAGMDTIGCSRSDIAIGTTPMQGVTYKWLHGDVVHADSGQTYFNSNNTLSTNQDYELVLETTRGSCSTTDTVVVTLYPGIQISMPNDVNVCLGHGVVIGALPTGGVGLKQFSWSPTDSLSNASSAITKANPIVTTVYTLQVLDGKNCKLVDSVRVDPVRPPIADFRFEDTCVGVAYQFTDLKKERDAPIDSFAWVLDNQLFANSHPGFTPGSDSIKSIRLTVLDTFGCLDTLTKEIRPYSIPELDFSPASVCQGDTLHVLNNSTINSGTMTNEWLLENTIYGGTDLRHAMKGYGEITVRLVATSDKGCRIEMTDTLTVFEKPKIQLLTANICRNQSTVFDVNPAALATDSIVRYDWEIGTGTTMSTRGDTTLTFTLDGAIPVQVIGITNQGCLDTALDTLDVFPLPVAQFSALPVCLGDTSKFVDLSTVSLGTINGRSWDVGTGYILGDSVHSNRFSNYGNKSIGLIAETDRGCRDTLIQQHRVLYEEDVVLRVTGHCEEEQIVFSVQTSNPDSIQSVQWDVNGAVSNGGLTHLDVFTTSGSIPVDIRLQFANGCSRDSIYTVTIDEKPEASFTFDLPCADNLVDFTSTSTSRTAAISAADWDFGDGNSGIGNTVQHTYGTTGTYDVSLMVENRPGCKDTIIRSVTIDQLVVPDFDIEDICALDSQWIRENSTGRMLPITRALWDMGNGDVRTSFDSFQYAFPNSGTYTVDLTYTTNPGCVYTVSKPVTVHELPVAGFIMNPDRADVVNSDVTFTSTSVGAVSHLYEFSHGDVVNTADFVYDFPDTATYTILQTVTNSFGCTDQYSADIIIDFVVNILIPNAFHPNDDQINNTFSPQGLGISNFDLKVFNRWGQLVYHSEDGRPWDGQDAMVGAYYYQIIVYDYNDARHNFSGVVYLMR
jgi:gliding motility-associated-like protein